MNKRQKEVLEVLLSDEKVVLKALENNYIKALADIKRNIRELQANPLTQSKAYQLEFQKQLEMQVSGILDNLQGKNFTSVAEYLQTSYTNGFIGNMYDLQGQNVPLVLPIEERQVISAVQKTGDDFKLSNKKGISTKELKKQVQAELARGLSTGLSYVDIARNISEYGLADMHRAMNIARTEGHRVQNQARFDSMQAAKEKGADIKKQWDSTLDGKTRPEHGQLDGQVRELEEDFTVAGYSAPHPGAFGDPYMDCNCRCCMLQRARWAVKGETSYQKWNNETGGFIECSGYDDFKKKYLKILNESDIIKTGKQLSDLGDFKKLLQTNTDISDTYYAVVKNRFSHGSKTAKSVFNKYVSEGAVADSNYYGTARYDQKTQRIFMSYENDINNPRGSGVTWFHEYAHLIDDKAGKPSQNKEFAKLLRTDYMDYMRQYGKANELNTLDKVQSAISRDLSDMRKHSGVSDILQGISKGNISGVAGHALDYWENPDNLCSEAFAHMFECEFDEVRYKQMRHYFPKSLKKFEEMLEGLV